MNIYMEVDADSFSEEVSQQGVLKPQYLLSQWETTEKFMGAEFLEQKQYSMYRQRRDASKRAEPVGPAAISCGYIARSAAAQESDLTVESKFRCCVVVRAGVFLA